MPRRIPDYNVVFADWNLVSSIGAFGMFITPFLMFAILWSSKRSGAKATNQVWEGAKGLEWTVPSPAPHHRSEEHTSELQSLMRISYAVFCLKKKKENKKTPNSNNTTERKPQ